MSLIGCFTTCSIAGIQVATSYFASNKHAGLVITIGQIPRRKVVITRSGPRTS